MDISDFDLSSIQSLTDNYIFNREYVFFDKEFFTLIEKMRDVYSVFNGIFDRWRRFDKITISKSVFDYETKVVNMARFCDRFYHFRFGDFEVYLRFIHNKFYAYCDFYDEDTYNKYFKHFYAVFGFDETTSKYIFRSGPYQDFKEASNVFLDYIHYFLRFDYELF